MRRVLKAVVLCTSLVLASACSESGECVGEATPCEDMPGSECSNQAGCTSGDTCGGSASSCSTHLDEPSCVGQGGCYWSLSSTTCSGTPTACEFFPPATCGLQEGCSVEAGCSGVAVKCESLTSAADCRAQAVCEWQTN